MSAKEINIGNGLLESGKLLIARPVVLGRVLSTILMFIDQNGETSTRNLAGVWDLIQILGWGQAEQNCVLSVHLVSCLYCTADQFLASGWPQKRVRWLFLRWRTYNSTSDYTYAHEYVKSLYRTKNWFYPWRIVPMKKMGFFISKNNMRRYQDKG